MTLQILREWSSPTEPPKMVKSCEKQKTGRPWMRPQPVTTPSPTGASLSGGPASWRTKGSISTKVPGSSKAAKRSRAVPLPEARCCAIRRSPPPAALLARHAASCSSFCCIEEFANDPGLLTLSGLPGLRGPPRALGAMGPSGAVGLPVLAEHFPQHAADLAHRRVSLDGPNQVGHQVV